MYHPSDVSQRPGKVDYCPMLHWCYNTYLSKVPVQHSSLPDQLALRLDRVGAGSSLFDPFNALHHQLAVFFLLLGTPFYDDNVEVPVQYHGTRHEQLLGVSLNLKLVGPVAEICHPDNHKIIR